MLKYHLNLVPVCYQNHSIFAPNSIPKTHLKSTLVLDAVLVSKIHENEAKREPKMLDRNCANRPWTLLSLPSLLSDGHVPSKIPQNALSRPPRVLPEHLKATKTASETACNKSIQKVLERIPETDLICTMSHAISIQHFDISSEYIRNIYVHNSQLTVKSLHLAIPGSQFIVCCP